MPQLNIDIRQLKGEDDPAYRFVIGSWLRNYETYRCEVLGERRREYYDNWTPRIRKHLQDGTVLVATLRDDPDTFVGWVCVEDNRLYYVYVKLAYRDAKVATRLIAEAMAEPGVLWYATKHQSWLAMMQRRGWRTYSDTEVIEYERQTQETNEIRNTGANESDARGESESSNATSGSSTAAEGKEGQASGTKDTRDVSG